jgi:hypothetical protein
MRIELQNIVEQKELNVFEMNKKLIENVCYNLPWICEDLYIESYKLDHYKAILKDMVKDCELTYEEIFDYWITKFQNFISQDYNVRENSSGTMHREVSTWKFVATMQMLKELKQIVKYSK